MHQPIGCVVAKKAAGVLEFLFLGGRFHVGSLGKQFTAAAILHLTELGHFCLNACINDVLPKQYRSDLWSAVSIKHLLSHTSGIPDYAIERDYYAVIDGWAFEETIDGMIGEAKDRPLEFEPGAEFRYSNIGYTLLGEILQRQTGRAFGDLVRDKLLLPIGMESSSIRDKDQVLTQGDPQGLRWDEETRVHVIDNAISLPVTPADGGLITTLDDFAIWVAAVYRDRSHPNLSPSSIELMLQRTSPSTGYRWPERDQRGEAFYGLGLMRSGDLVMHEGSIVGYRSFFIYSCQDDVLISVFSNNTHNNVFRIAAELFACHTECR